MKEIKSPGPGRRTFRNLSYKWAPGPSRGPAAFRPEPTCSLFSSWALWPSPRCEKRARGGPFSLKEKGRKAASRPVAVGLKPTRPLRPGPQVTNRRWRDHRGRTQQAWSLRPLGLIRLLVLMFLRDDDKGHQAREFLSSSSKNIRETA